MQTGTTVTWYSSRRKAELPKNWADLRRAAQRRAGGGCEHIINGQRCSNRGTELHHTGRPDDHRLVSLEWICTDCHKRETQHQSLQARGIAGRLRPAETHPGMHPTTPGKQHPLD